MRVRTPGSTRASTSTPRCDAKGARSPTRSASSRETSRGPGMTTPTLWRASVTAVSATARMRASARRAASSEASPCACAASPAMAVMALASSWRSAATSSGGGALEREMPPCTNTRRPSAVRCAHTSCWSTRPHAEPRSRARLKSACTSRWCTSLRVSRSTAVTSPSSKSAPSICRAAELSRRTRVPSSARSEPPSASATSFIQAWSPGVPALRAPLRPASEGWAGAPCTTCSTSSRVAPESTASKLASAT
jgi:hypothetical protein